MGTLKEEKNRLLRIILGIETIEERKSTLQLALKQARRLIGISKGEKANMSNFQMRRSIDSFDMANLAETAMSAVPDDEMDILTSLSLYLIALDQLGHIFSHRSVKSNRVKFALELNNTATGLTDTELDEIANLRNSINHNFGLACYSPNKNIGVFKYTICFDDDGNQRPVADAIEKWEGDWCDKNENTSVHIYPFSLINYIEQVLSSFVEQHLKEKLKSPLCVEELKTRFTITLSSIHAE